MPSIGAYLARQRRLRGMDLDELVAITKIPRRSLERLEAGAFDGHSDGFVRGFVRTVAVAIGLDPHETVTRMLAEPILADAGRWLSPAQAVGSLAVVLALALLGIVLVDQMNDFGRDDPAEEEVVLTPAPPALPGLGGDRILRRDPVRDLARERGVLGEQDAPPRSGYDREGAASRGRPADDVVAPSAPAARPD